MNSRKIHLISWVIFVCIMVFFSYYFYILAISSNDFSQYISFANRLKGDPLSYSFAREITEPFYLLIFWLLSNIFSAKTVVLLAGFIPFVFKSLIIKSNSYYPFIALIFYCGFFLPLHDANQIRLAAACVPILYTMMSIKNLTNSKIIFFSICATAFHYTGIVLLILIFKNRKYLAFSLMVIGSFLFVPIFEYIETINESFNLFNRYTSESEALGLTSPYFLLHAAIAISVLFIWESLNNYQKRGALFIVMGALAFILFQNLELIAVRIRELGYLGIIPLMFSSKIKLTIPWLVIIISSILTIILSLYEIWIKLLNFMI